MILNTYYLSSVQATQLILNDNRVYAVSAKPTILVLANSVSFISLHPCYPFIINILQVVSAKPK